MLCTEQLWGFCRRICTRSNECSSPEIRGNIRSERLRSCCHSVRIHAPAQEVQGDWWTQNHKHQLRSGKYYHHERSSRTLEENPFSSESSNTWCVIASLICAVVDLQLKQICSQFDHYDAGNDEPQYARCLP